MFVTGIFGFILAVIGFYDRFIKRTARVDDEPRESSVPARETEAVQLSQDLSEFLRLRNLNEPRINHDDWENSINQMLQYSGETMNLYYRDFAPRVAAIRQEFIERGVTDNEFDRLYEHPTNPLGLQALALRIVELSLTLEETEN